jgi:hypothetical protein
MKAYKWSRVIALLNLNFGDRRRLNSTVKYKNTLLLGKLWSER